MALTKISRGLLNTGISDSSDATAITIDSSENVGIGVTSPDCDLHINGATNSEQVIITGGNNASRGLSISTVANNGQSDAGVIFNAQDTENASYPALIYQTGGSERMRIDGSGTVLVGKTAEGTATDGIELNRQDVIVATRDGDSPLLLNRKSSDGDIINLRKDNANVGSIGANGGRPYLVNNVDGGIHLSTDGYGRALLLPADQTGAPEDNLHYLGSSSYRWRDIYLSNAAYLGGTATANALDDYEEGTWTATLAFGGNSVGLTYSVRTGYYTKVGRIVTATLYVLLTDKGSSTGNITLSGLPHTALGSNAYAAASLHLNLVSFSGFPQAYVITGSTFAYFGQTADSGTFTQLTNSNISNATGIIFTVTYQTA